MFISENCKSCVWYEEPFGCPENVINGVCVEYIEYLSIPNYKDTRWSLEFCLDYIDNFEVNPEADYVQSCEDYGFPCEEPEYDDFALTEGDFAEDCISSEVEAYKAFMLRKDDAFNTFPHNDTDACPF